MDATETVPRDAKPLWKCQGFDWRMRVRKMKWIPPQSPEADKGQTVPCSASLLNVEPSAGAAFPKANFLDNPDFYILQPSLPALDASLIDHTNS
jgi:hypothetical protein